MAHPIIFVTVNDTPGLLYVNGRLSGDLAEPQAVPVAPNGPVFLEYRPFGQECLPMAHRLDFVGGEMKIPAAEYGCLTTAWPGSYVDVRLLPPRAAELVPRILERAAWPDGTVAELVSQQGALYLQVNGGTLLSHRLPEGARTGSLALAGALLCAHGECGGSGEYMTAVSREDGYRVVFEASGSRVHLPEGEGPILVERDMNDLVGHSQTHIYAPDDQPEAAVGIWKEVSIQQTYTNGVPNIPKTPVETARAFIEAVAVHALEEAGGYLAPSIAPYEAFARIGEAESCVDLKYPIPPVMPITLGVKSSPRAGFEKVEAVGFEVAAIGPQGEHRITSIRRLA